MFFPKCSTCHEYIDLKSSISLFKESEGCRTTHLSCIDCYEKNKDKWDENNWVIIMKQGVKNDL
jgi:hypothetical protein